MCASNGKIVRFYFFKWENILTVSVFFSRSTSTTASLSLTTAAASAPSTSPSSAWSSPAPASQGARRGSHPASSAAAPTGWRGRTAIDARSDTGPTPASGAGVRRQNTFPAKKKKGKYKNMFFCHFQSATATRWAPSPPLATRRPAAASASLATRGSSARSAPMARWRTSPSVSEVRSLSCYYKLLFLSVFRTFGLFMQIRYQW